METRHEGLQTRVAHENSLAILRHPERGLDDFVLVSDDDVEEAILLLLEHTRNLAEGAGAAALAAAMAQRETLAGKKVAVVISGGNIMLETLQAILARRR